MRRCLLVALELLVSNTSSSESRRDVVGVVKSLIKLLAFAGCLQLYGVRLRCLLLYSYSDLHFLRIVLAATAIDVGCQSLLGLQVVV